MLVPRPLLKLLPQLLQLLPLPPRKSRLVARGDSASSRSRAMSTFMSGALFKSSFVLFCTDVIRPLVRNARIALCSCCDLLTTADSSIVSPSIDHRFMVDNDLVGGGWAELPAGQSRALIVRVANSIRDCNYLLSRDCFLLSESSACRLSRQQNFPLLSY